MAGFSALKGSLLILSHGLTDCLCVAFPYCMQACGKYLGHPTVGMTGRFVAAVASPRLIQVLEHMLAFWRTEAMQKINVEEALWILVETRLCTRYSDATESLTSHKAELRAELLTHTQFIDGVSRSLVECVRKFGAPGLPYGKQ